MDGSRIETVDVPLHPPGAAVDHVVAGDRGHRVGLEPDPRAGMWLRAGRDLEASVRRDVEGAVVDRAEDALRVAPVVRAGVSVERVIDRIALPASRAVGQCGV